MEKSNKLTLEDIGSFLEKLAEKSENVYWLSSPDFTKIQYVSPAYEKIWGRPRAILYSEPELWTTYLHPEDIKKHNPIHAMAERLVKEGPAARYYENYRIIRPDGEVRWIIDQGFPIYNEKGKCCGVTGVAVDITKDKVVEELREAKEKAETANKAKTEFLENMRHDIRTPLIGITGFADLIKSEVTDPKIKEYADNLIASSYSLLDLLNEVLEAIKVSSGEIPFLKKKFNLQKKLKEVILLNQANASHKNLKLLFEYDTAIPTYLMGDSTRIHRIVLELVTNALNFTHHGHVKLSAQLAKDHENDAVVKIIVEDTGIGIAPEKQQEIYIQFKRLTPSYEGIYKGIGLGLSIAKQFIDDLQGELYVESQVDVGSKFTFIVKLKKALLDEELGSEDLIPLNGRNKFNPPPEIKSFERMADHATESYKSRILVVEDSALAAHIVTNMLATMDCTVDIAERGKLAVQLAEENQYDLIFMDIGLPDIDGYETTKRIRLNELHKQHVPIIALTAHAGEENKQYCIGIGMNAILTKPLIKTHAEDILNSFIPYRKNKLTIAEKPDSFEKIAPNLETDVFDFELLTEQCGDVESAIEMVTMFLDEQPGDLEQIETAYKAKNWSMVQEMVHKFNGGVSYCAMMRLREACCNLESSIKAGKSKLSEDLYHQLLEETSLAKKAMKERLILQ